jgi:predicted enzyme related to lactoylglutathione lyase
MAHPIVHFELSAQDPRAAGEWYNNLFGWPVTVSDQWDYVMVTTQERFGGGFNPVGPDMPAGTSIVYIATDDFDATFRRIQDAGGVVVTSRQDLPGVGAIGTFKDPTGNVVGLIQPDTSAMENAPPPAPHSYPHPIVHFELSANDPKAAGEWYNGLFGWPMSHFPEFNYVGFMTQENFGGGFANVNNGIPAGTTVIYIETDDIAAMVDQVEAAGAMILMRGDPIPGIGVIGMFRDSTGNTMGLLQPEMPAGAAQASGQTQAA